MGVDRARIDGVPVSPDLLEQILAGLDRSGLADQQREKLELS
jgi:hypothetical protein